MRLAELEMLNTQTVSTPKKYYVVYARKSSEGEDRQTQSINDQLKEAKEIVDSKKLQVLETFTESRSAKSPGRLEFNKMIELINSRDDIKGIVTWTTSRLSRNPKDEGTLRWLLQSGQIEEIVTKEKTFTVVDADFVMAIEGSQSQRFITDLRKDTLRGIESKLNRGLAPVLAPPGYMNDLSKRQGERDIKPSKHFKLMRTVFEKFLTGNYTIEQLTEYAAQVGIKNSRNKSISYSQMSVILKNPFYTGRFVYGGKIYKGVHKPMINDSEFDAIQRILESRVNPRTSINHDLLSGLIRCGECGRSITAERKKKLLSTGITKEYVMYRCSKKGTKCKQKYINAIALEEAIDTHLSRIELAPRFTNWAIKWLKVQQQNYSRNQKISLRLARSEYDSVEKKLNRVNDLMIEGALTSEEGRLKKIELNLEKERLFKKQINLHDYSTQWHELSIKTFEFIKTMRQVFKEGTVTKRKAILRTVGVELILLDKRLQIELRQPFKYIEEVALQVGKHKVKSLPVPSAKSIIEPKTGSILELSSTQYAPARTSLKMAVFRVRNYYRKATPADCSFYKNSFKEINSREYVQPMI